jgi:hypothetical protein
MNIFNSLSLLGVVCLIFSECKNEKEDSPPANPILLSSEADRFFSTPSAKDHFTIQVRGPELLTSTAYLEITSPDGRKILEQQWMVSDFFSIPDNHYLDKAGKEHKIRNSITHFFDTANFNAVRSLQINSLWKSSDEPYWKDIKQDSTSVGFSYIKEDRCISYSKKYKTTITFRALKKKKYRLPAAQ